MKYDDASWHDNNRRLNILGIVYYVIGGVVALTGIVCFFNFPSSGFYGGSMLLIGAICLVAGACLATVGRMMRVRRGRLFCIIVGYVICPVFIPIGTVIGVFTIVLLSRDDVKASFLVKDSKGPNAGGGQARS